MPVLETYFESPHHFGVAFNALGRNYDTTINGFPVTISLPSVRWSGDEGQIRADLDSPLWEHVPDDHDWSKTLDTHWPWGSVSTYRTDDRETGSAWVSHFRVSTNCTDGPDAAQSAANSMLDALDDWWPSVCDWIEVLTRQVHGVPRATVVLGDSHPVWTEIHGTRRRLFSRSPQVVNVVHLTGTGGPDALTPSLFQSALDQAMIAPPPTEWLLVRDGHIALETGATRRAVIDAGTASELAVTKLIQDQLAASPEDIIQAMLEGYRMLSNRIKLLRKFAGAASIPNNVSSVLVEPRNRATHQGANPSAAEAGEALRIAAELVEAAYPLVTYH